MADSLNHDLTGALSALAGGVPLRDGAAALLGALGYRSRRTADAGSVAEFLERLDSDKPLTDRQRALFEPWRAVEIVFQLTDAEIGGRPGLFDEIGGFERGRIESFLFLAADLAGSVHTRTHLAETVRAVNARHAMPVVVLFRHGPSLTLAAVHRRTHRRDTERDVLEKVTLVKDVRASAPHRAHVDVLADLALPAMIRSGVRDFDGLHAAWEKVLDIEALNRRFYRELFNWFQRATDECRFPDDGAGDGSTERHVIRLVTRLLFIWFLKEKKLVPDELFDESFARQALRKHAPDGTDYYRAVLQNLFFATLNTEIDKRAFSTRNRATHRDFTRYRYRSMLADPDGFMALLRSVPFVNGGLFDCLDDFASAGAGGRRIDAFTDNVETHGKDLDVPARLFLDPGEGLFPLFRRYKFTVEENTPLDREVALDPELLGRAFENLLAAYNPETRETARKATGSYYTPRHIVDYMVGEALVAALAGKARPADGDAAGWRARLGYLLDWGREACDDAATPFDADETDSLVRAIADLRVLDPAAGSGAFPMGVLHRLTLALRRLDPRNERWEALQKKLAAERAGPAFDTRDEPARNAELVEISRVFETYRDSDFGRKLYLIQNGIYGVDIQPVACQIAKLRFFVSLTVEQEANDDPADNHGIRPLPNLETRFVAADTLIGLRAETASLLLDDEVADRRKEIAAVRERYFLADNRRDKLDRIKEEQGHRDELRKILRTNAKAWTTARERDIERKARGLPNPEEREKFRQEEIAKLAERRRRYDEALADARKVSEWDPYDQNARADWFDPEWMFGVADGFDVVIGNPPYVRADFQDERHKKTRSAILASGDYETLWEKWDLFVPFMEKGFKLLRGGGASSLIVSDAFGHAKYALKAREWFLRNALVERVDFFSRIKIFDAAVHNLSYLFRKADGSGNEPLRRLHEPAFGEITALSTAEQGDLDERAFFPEDLYRPPAVPTIRLADLCYVSVGMVVHAHERHAHGAFSLEDVVSDRKDDRHPKPFVEGKHLDRWLPATNRWLEWGTERAPALFRRKTFPELYDVDEKIVVQRSPGPDPKACYDNGQLHFDASSVGFILWKSLEGTRNRSIRKQARYADEKRRNDLPRREDLERNSRRFSIKYLLGVINSASAQDFLRAHRRSNIHLYPDDWKKLPIPDITSDAQRPVIDLVDDILATKDADPDADVTARESEIDRLVHALYGLTGDESAAVEGSPAVGSAADGTARTAAGGAGPTG